MAEVVAAGVAVTTAIIQAKTALWEPLKRTIASSNDMDEIYGALDEAMQTLIAIRDDHEVTVERHKTTMMPSNTYTNWINRVNVVAKEVDNLNIRYTKEQKRSPWFFINSRSNFTRKMRKTASRVFALIEEDTHLTGVLVHKKPACVVEMITPRITNIPTLQHPLEQTLGWLSDKKVRGVRIHGLIGSGKTTVMQNLNNHVKVAEMFDVVIWVTVSREGSMENRGIDQIQQVIAQRLKLNIEVTHLDLVASRIREELKDIKYLLLLDDVKEDLNLEKVGVPISENGSKIVFTTRLQHVCSSIATRQANVATLNRKEALNMFKCELDRPHLEENSNIKRLMSQIVNWCGYHPLMIKVAAGVFRVKETEESWHDGLMNLRKWPERGDDTMQEIYNLLKCFFDCLKVTQKKCFFYSALYPEDSDIQKDCLLDNWVAEELLETNGDVEEMHVNGRDVLEYLKMVSLLEENTSQECIRMHKLIRLAALYNLSTDEDQANLVKSGEALQKPLDVECWKDKRWISLVDSKMNALPDQPNCSMLSTLFLQKNPNLEVIPQAFFKHMQSLHVLDLYDTRIRSLPSSLLKLISLKVLYLQKCVALVELPCEIGNLQKLEVLDIRGSGLANIPPQVENLICLRRLLVSFACSKGRTPIQEATNDIEVISRIPMLKELVIDVEEGFESILYGVIVSIVRVRSLSLLQFCSPNKVTYLIKAIGGSWKISFPTENLLQSYINKVDSFEFKECQIFIGCDISSQPHIMKFMPYYKFNGEVSNNTISQVLRNDVAIELVNHNELEHLSTFTVEDMNRIRSCVIKGCNKIRTMVDGRAGGSLVLDKLKQLHMINLPVLENIYEGPMQGFYSLKTLILHDCPKLTCVCAYGVILQLPWIRHLEVKGCSEIKEIFSEPANIVSPILPNLKKLILVDMPQLRSILVSDSCKWPSLERLKILGCPELKRLPFQRDAGVKLTSIQAEKSWWEALENDQEVKAQFRRYCTLS